MNTPDRSSDPVSAGDRPSPPFPTQPIDPPGLEQKMDPAPRYRGADYREADKLKGRTALITGGDSGIGRAVAVLFAREGADVAIVHLPEEQPDADRTCEAIEGFGRRALSIAGDVADPAFCASAVERCVNELGGLDLLVNNAAVQEHLDAIDDLTVEHWERTFRVNIHGYFYMTKAALPHLPEGSAIVNTGSVTGLEGNGELLDYASTKGAIHAFTKSLAQALVERRIRVNCVAPGPVWTPLNPAERDPDEVREFGADQPFERPAQPDEIAPAYVYFASNADSSYVTGQVLSILGGQTRAG
ncbi:SDR family oxidoreductase [Gaopeijia maritima]|uniref:SDR family oxidoreductase n=1 Tax=Gaopeijia maritima TaxID=3119007 RepID=UPI0032480BB5